MAMGALDDKSLPWLEIFVKHEVVEAALGSDVHRGSCGILEIQ
jgi:hypothetical protein